MSDSTKQYDPEQRVGVIGEHSYRLTHNQQALAQHHAKKLPTTDTTEHIKSMFVLMKFDFQSKELKQQGEVTDLIVTYGLGNYDLPEFVLIGNIPYPIVNELLEAIALKAMRGDSFDTPFFLDEYSGIFAAVDVSDTNMTQWTKDLYPRPNKLYQIFVSDINGRFPWDTQYIGRLPIDLREEETFQ